MILVTGCREASSATTASTERELANGYETARVVLIEYFVALAGDDRRSAEQAVCDPGGLGDVFVAYRRGVDAVGPIRLVVSSVDSAAATGEVAFEVSTAQETFGFVALLESDPAGGVCLASISHEGSTAGLPLPISADGT